MAYTLSYSVPASLLEAIMEEPERFVKEFLSGTSSRILSFDDFKRMFTGYGRNDLLLNNCIGHFSKSEFAVLFASRPVQNRVYRDLLFNNDGDERKAKSELSRENARLDIDIQIGAPAIKAPIEHKAMQETIPSFAPKREIYGRRESIGVHKWKGKEVKGYVRGFQNWTPAHSKFISVRKQQGLRPRQIYAEYNQHFKNQPRSFSSIRTKTYRMK